MLHSFQNAWESSELPSTHSLSHDRSLLEKAQVLMKYEASGRAINASCQAKKFLVIDGNSSHNVRHPVGMMMSFHKGLVNEKGVPYGRLGCLIR